MPAGNRKKQEAGGALASADLRAKIAWLYHVEGLTQARIAKLVGVTRVKVIRELATIARDQMVITTVNADTTGQIALERALEARWGLRSAVVAPAPADADNLGRLLGHAVARYLTEHMGDGMTLAIGGGATLNGSLAFLARRELAGATIVSLVGSLPHSRWINPSIVAAKVAERFNIDSYQITAPVVVDEPELRERLWRQSALKEVRERAAGADMALLTVGEHSSDATIFRHGIVPDALLEPLRRRGAVANLLCYFVDAQGRLVDHEINRRIMAIGLDEVARIPHIILAAGGPHKVEAILAALKAVPVKVLITDAATAAEMLEAAPGPAAPELRSGRARP